MDTDLGVEHIDPNFMDDKLESFDVKTFKDFPEELAEYGVEVENAFNSLIKEKDRLVDDYKRYELIENNNEDNGEFVRERFGECQNKIQTLKDKFKNFEINCAMEMSDLDKNVQDKIKSYKQLYERRLQFIINSIGEIIFAYTTFIEKNKILSDNTLTNQQKQHKLKILIENSDKRQKSNNIKNYKLGMTYEATMKMAQDIQQESLKSIERSKKSLRDTIEIGTNTLEQLKLDTEKLQNVQEDLEEMDSELSMAKKQLRGIVRRLGRDKCIRVMCILVLLGLLGVLIYFIVKRKTFSVPVTFIPSPN